MKRIACFPDLHPGKGVPIGAAFGSSGVIYPHLIGNDIGCGMALWECTVPLRKVRLGAIESSIEGLESPATADERVSVCTPEIAATAHTRSLGTIGGGNHFAELQAIEEIRDEDRFAAAHLDRAASYLLIHSGSRGLGEEILCRHLIRHGGGGLESGSSAGEEYRNAHDLAVAWAGANRALIATRFVRFMKGEVRLVVDLPHNLLERVSVDGMELELHRKGANRSAEGLIVIPGSRGTLTYLVEPIGTQERNLLSLSHGAGRKWRRKECKARLQEKFDRRTLLRTPLGGRVICDDAELLYQEAPPAYKNIRSVIGALEREGLIRVIATLRPLLTYKTRKHR